jgi:hypothetical protein
MGELNDGQVLAMVNAIAGMVRRNGQHDFKKVSGGHECSAAHLCGLCVHSNGTELLRIHAADLDIELGETANDSMRSFLRFRRGTPAILQNWHGRLGHLHAFLSRDAA